MLFAGVCLSTSRAPRSRAVQLRVLLRFARALDATRAQSDDIDPESLLAAGPRTLKNTRPPWAGELNYIWSEAG